MVVDRVYGPYGIDGEGSPRRRSPITQPRVSDLVRGRLDLFSIETLIEMLAHFGIRVKLVLQAPRKRAGVA